MHNIHLFPIALRFYSCKLEFNERPHESSSQLLSQMIQLFILWDYDMLSLSFRINTPFLSKNTIKSLRKFLFFFFKSFIMVKWSLIIIIIFNMLGFIKLSQNDNYNSDSHEDNRSILCLFSYLHNNINS